ncbi:MAG TPA: ABC transporter substrate-binding protein [Acholeplasmataceae bacterium]|nr:ABC transporter substrate-binding protein [Acholeplasmataceae bacterium]
MTIKRLIIIALGVVLSLWIIIGLFSKDEAIMTHDFKKDIELSTFEDAEYQSYLTSHEDVFSNESYILTGDHIDPVFSHDYEIVSGDSYGKSSNLILTGETSSVRFNVDVNQSGYYHIEVSYFPVEGKSSRIERELKINEVTPYRAAQKLSFARIWVSQTEGFTQDRNGNDIIPRQIEEPRWVSQTLKDSEGLIKEDLRFYFEDGVNTLDWIAYKEPMLIESITIYQKEDLNSYEVYQNEHQNLANNLNGDEMIIIEGQDMHEKSSPTLYPIADRTSAISTPQSSYALRANSGGGYNWRIVGDWISYTFDVEKAGFYNISMRAKQSYIRGAYVTRKVMIDGEVPFNEVSEVPFIYSGNWNVYTMGEEEAFEFYLTPGTHEISFEVVLGDFNTSIREVTDVITTLNEVYRDIIMITTAQPDLYRDYLLNERLPEMLPTFEETKETLEKISEDLFIMTGESSTHTVILDKVALQLEAFIKEPETIHKRLAEYQTNISALGTWVLEIKEQPLAIDYIAIHSPETKIEKINANVFESFWFSLNNFIASFVVDYNSLASSADDENLEGNITVWIGSGRDQANIMRRMIDEEFTSTYNIGVNLQLVSMDVLLPSTLTKSGPDVAIGVGNSTPVNYAMRNAVYDLSQFDDFDLVKERFQESAFVPYAYLDGYYGLPDTQQFPVMFYRKDILDELNIDIPETWQDVIEIIPELQRVNLDFYLPIDIVENVQGVLAPNVMFVTLLYQNGGELYLEDGRISGLSERVALDSFKQWTDFYTNYRFQIQANFVNRFRSGEMPIGIAYYSMYNTLSVFAPEISGNWGFTAVPGVKQEDDSINHVVPTTGTAILLMNQSKQKALAWEFMKWWTEEDTQVRFGREMEGILGAAARYPTANVSALEKLPWPAQDLAVLKAQWDQTRGMAEVPGGYFTGRHLDNALRKVINTGANPRDTLYEYTAIINSEIESKRKEFDLD